MKAFKQLRLALEIIGLAAIDFPLNP